MVLFSRRKIFSLIIATILFSTYYTGFIPGFTLADLLISFIIIEFIIGKIRKKNIKIKTETLFLISLIILILLTTLITFQVQNKKIDLIVLSRILRFIMYVFTVIIIIPNKIDKNFFISVYMIVVVIAMSYLFLQYFLFQNNIMVPIKILPIPYYNDQFIYNPYLDTMFRPASFFAEPSHYAQFMIPSIVILIFSDKINLVKKVFYITVIVSSILITTSTIGIVLAFLAIIISVFITNNKKFIRKSLTIALFGIAIFLIVRIISPEIIEYTLSKIKFDNISPGSSEAFRIYRGWAILNKIDLKYNLLGIGHGNLGMFVLNNEISTIYDPEIMNLVSADYASGMSLMFLYYGVINSTSILLCMLYCYHNTLKQGKAIMFIYLLLMFVSSTLFDINFVFYFTFIIIFMNNKTFVSKKGKNNEENNDNIRNKARSNKNVPTC